MARNEPRSIVRIPRSPALTLSRSGAGAQTILFLHGIGGNRRNWDAQLDVLGREFTCLAWDMRGYGDSEAFDEPVRFSDWVADVRRIVDSLAIDRVHLVGLSLGGRIAQRFSIDHRDRVASLVLADTRSEKGNVRTAAQKKEFYDMRARPILAGKTMAEIAPVVAKSLMGPHAGPEVLAALVDSMTRVRPKAYLNAIAANLDEDYVGDVSDIRVPTLVVVGEHDSLTPPELSRRLAEEIAGASFVQIARAGHLSNIEEPAAFNEALLSFYRNTVLRDPSAR